MLKRRGLQIPYIIITLPSTLLRNEGLRPYPFGPLHVSILPKITETSKRFLFFFTPQKKESMVFYTASPYVVTQADVYLLGVPVNDISKMKLLTGFYRVFVFR